MNLFIHNYFITQDSPGCQVLTDQATNPRAAMKGIMGTWPSQIQVTTNVFCPNYCQASLSLKENPEYPLINTSSL